MQLIKKYISYPYVDIQETIQFAQYLVTKYIRIPLKIPSDISRRELFKIILRDLKNLNYKIDFPDMPHFDNRYIPAIQKINGGKRENGGVIKVNMNLGDLAKIEGILHEYIHIRVPILPIQTTNKENDFYWIDSRAYNLTITELLVEFCFLSLWLPQEKILSELKFKKHNIDEFIQSYPDVKKSTLLQWIALICPFTCHFAWVVIPKDAGHYLLPDICDRFRYIHNQNHKLEDFYFDAILRYPGSIAAQALAVRESESGESTINGTIYQCYAYYENDLFRSKSNDFFPGINSENYDQLLVIGWNTADSPAN